MFTAVSLGLQMAKRAGLYSEVLGGVPATLTPLAPLAGLANLGGTVSGHLAHPYTPEEQINAAGETATNFIPGVGMHRLGKRMNRVALDVGSTHPVLNPMAERFGLFANMAGSAVGGGLAGALATGGQPIGALAGAGIGAGLSVGGGVLGALIAGITDRRNEAAQHEADVDPWHALKSVALPGHGVYSMFKRLGYSTKYDAEADSRAQGK